MNLPPEQTARFYHIWFELLKYVNKQKRLAPRFPATPEQASIAPDDAMQLRNALWADDALRESFIAGNPAGLSPADLALVASWQHRIAGDFFVMRHLKKYSVFLSHQPNHAYGVLGLVSPIEEIIGPSVPIYVRAVLLPFEDKIIYDSLLEPFGITFGPGMRSGFNDTYRNVQEREGIITSLEPTVTLTDPKEERSAVRARNAKILSAFRRDMARVGLSHKMVEQHASTIDAFAQNYLLAQDPPRGLLDITLADVQAYLHTMGDRANTVSFKRFIRFLVDTGRMDYEQAEPLSNFLKHTE